MNQWHSDPIDVIICRHINNLIEWNIEQGHTKDAVMEFINDYLDNRNDYDSGPRTAMVLDNIIATYSIESLKENVTLFNKQKESA